MRSRKDIEVRHVAHFLTSRKGFHRSNVPSNAQPLRRPAHLIHDRRQGRRAPGPSCLAVRKQRLARDAGVRA